MLPEPQQLRVVPIPARAAGQDGLGEQGFAPGARQALAVEVAGMKGLQAHAPILPAWGNPGTWG